MWCAICHYGSEVCYMTKWAGCPNCGCKIFLSESPFPEHPTTVGKGPQRAKKQRRNQEDAPAAVLEREANARKRIYKQEVEQGAV